MKKQTRKNNQQLSQLNHPHNISIFLTFSTGGGREGGEERKRNKSKRKLETKTRGWFIRK